MAHPDGDDGDDRCDYAPEACVEGDSDDDDGEYDYAPAASMEGDDDDDGGYDYEPAAWVVVKQFVLNILTLFMGFSSNPNFF